MDPESPAPVVFQADCGGPFDLTPDHTITSFESEPTSGAESAIIAFLKSEPQHYVGKTLLHVGVGNGALPAEFATDLARYLGITISVPEVELFEGRFARVANVSAIVLNKYDPRTYDEISGPYDIIVDTLLKSVACCEKHFQQMMEFYAGSLAHRGTLITTESGINWGWKGNTRRAYTPGSQVDPAVGAVRVLGRDGLERLAERLGLTVESVKVPNANVVYDGSEDAILILTKDESAVRPRNRPRQEDPKTYRDNESHGEERWPSG